MKKKYFNIPFIGIKNFEKYSVIYGEKGNSNVILEFQNPILEYCCEEEQYNNYHNIMANIVKNLPEAFYLQKVDIILKDKFTPAEEKSFLQKKYNEHFEGRKYLRINSYLVIGQTSTILKYDEKKEKNFRYTINKIIQILIDNGLYCRPLEENEIDNLIRNFITLSFNEDTHSLNNICANENFLKINNKFVKTISLVDVEEMGVPREISPSITSTISAISLNYSTDFINIFSKLEDFEIIIYNQAVKIPNQRKEISRLELKKKRHRSFSDPENDISADDIDCVMDDIARNNDKLGYGTFNITIVTNQENKLEKTINSIESMMFMQGVITGKNDYNQMELFRGAIPANIPELDEYNYFLATVDSLICFFIKRHSLKMSQVNFI